MTIIDLDPNLLTAHPTNVRNELGNLDDLTASIAQVGVLEPVVVVPIEDGHRIIAGHRRAAAAAAVGLDAVPCIERPDLAGASDQVVAMLAENLRRADLTDAEEAAGYQQLLDLGMSATRIAKATGTTRTRVRQALTLAKHPTAVATAHDHRLSLDQALVLAEFSADDDAMERLTATLDDDPGEFEHVASGLRLDRELRAAYETLVDEHRTAGITLLEESPASYDSSLTSPRTLLGLRSEDGEPLDADNHTTCPGHAVWISQPTWTHPRPVHACMNPAEYGHRNRHGGHDSGTGETTPEEAKAERREVIQNNKAWRAAEPVRRDYVRQLLASTKVPAGTLRYIVEEIMADPSGIGHGPDELLGDLVGITPRESDRYWERTAGPDLATRTTDARLPLALLAQLAAAREQSMTVQTWRQTSPHPEARWLSFLARCGYHPSAIERRVIDTLTPQTDDVS